MQQNGIIKDLAISSAYGKAIKTPDLFIAGKKNSDFSTDVVLMTVFGTRKRLCVRAFNNLFIRVIFDIVLYLSSKSSWASQNKYCAKQIGGRFAPLHGLSTKYGRNILRSLTLKYAISGARTNVYRQLTVAIACWDG